ncbi:MAG: hypothetical protein COX57_04020 [Alphaproteobacteria bacterium CG_4_10_14_0_2_um_filter_63_37]|nr:MAG: hypothetical protein COX57_04020 [Alphaproteobacteria bacterium CG_4_10_14_0_2_um_filter_63_37]
MIQLGDSNPLDLQTWRERALKMLTLREHAPAELHGKLLAKGASEEEAEAAVAWCLELGYLDAARFKQAVVRQAERQHKGRIWAIERCRRAGEDPPDRETLDHLDEVAARDFVARQGQIPADPAARRRYLSRLQRLGLPLSLVRKITEDRD